MTVKRKRALILLNISSGTGRAPLFVMEIIKRFAKNGFEPVIFPIIPGSDLISEKILPEYENSADIVLCIGGDGTLNHVIQTIMRQDVRPLLAYVPMGSTNDFAKGLGISTEPEKALDMVFSGRKFSYDIGRLNERFFNYVAAFGAFSAVSYATDQQLKNVLGHAAYIISAIGDFTEHLRYNCHLKITTEDGTEEGDYIFGAVCNTVSVGGFPLFRSTNIQLNDGKMELFLIKSPKTAADLQETLNAVLTRTFDSPSITFKQVSAVSLSADSDIAWTLDGEYGGAYKEVRIEVQKQAISIMSGLE